MTDRVSFPVGLEPTARRVEEFFLFMKERHNVYVRRAKGQPFPWTADEILSTYRFCNVYRELDKVTVWVREHVREPFSNHKLLWLMLCAARQINHPDTLAELIADKKAWPHTLRSWDPERMRTIMNDRKARGEQVYTGAYMLTNVLDKNDNSQPHDKPFFTAHRVLAPLVGISGAMERAASCSMADTHGLLRAQFGWGGFLSYEVTCDMRWTRYGARWADVNTFAFAGPGAVRGLNRLLQVSKDCVLAPPVALKMMRALLSESKSFWPRAWPKLELREIEHSLCEFDKYERVRLGEGRPRAKYHHQP